jgi:hypothetical protein
VKAHLEAVEAARLRYREVVEVLTAQGSIVCRPPIDDLEAAYCRYIDGMVDVGLKRESASTVNRRLVEACVVVPDPSDKKAQKSKLTAIFRKRPALIGELVQKLVKLAGGDESANIAGN